MSRRRPPWGFLRLVACLSVTVGVLGAVGVARTAAAAAAPRPVGSLGGANLLFSDEFDGTTLNSSKWHTCFWWAGTTCSIETNNELELYTKNNVSVANGMLKLQARRQLATGWNGKSYAFTSGMISSGGLSGQTAPGFTFKYGYVEARVKVPSGQGLWPAFWLLPANHSWPPEIDVMEILGQQTNVQNMTYHYLDANGTNLHPGSTYVGPDFSAGWHTFGVDWQPNALVWYVDGIERWRFTDAASITSQPQYILLNLAVGGSWPGPPNSATPFPNDYLVDYVRVWDRFQTAPPPLSGYSAVVAGDSPASYWRLGELTGTSAADTLGGNTGTYRNGVALGAASLVGTDPGNRAASFDGVNDSVSVPNGPGLSPTVALTVEAWVRPAVIPGAGEFASVVTKAESYSLQFNGPTLEMTTIQNGVRRRVQAPPGAIVADRTYYIVGTYDGTTQRLFINGVPVASGAYSGMVGVNRNSLMLGSWDGSSEFLSGVIDEVAVYDKVLTGAQIANHYNQGVTRG